MKATFLLALALSIFGCAANRPDHFYVLDSSGGRALAPRTRFATQVTLRVKLPVVVDRSELVLINPQGVQILEHERWAAPLADQVTSVLGQDIEARREDVFMEARRSAQPGPRHVAISVDVVQLDLQRGIGVRLEARWRLQGSGDGEVLEGRETFTAPVADADYASFTRSIDSCLGLLADRLVAGLPSQ